MVEQVTNPFVPSVVEGPCSRAKHVSTALDTNGDKVSAVAQQYDVMVIDSGAGSTAALAQAQAIASAISLSVRPDPLGDRLRQSLWSNQGRGTLLRPRRCLDFARHERI
jgi:hypothetical protein